MFFPHPLKNLSLSLHASCILVRKKLEKRLCLTGTRGHPVKTTKNTPKKGTKKAETLKFFEHFDYLLIGVTGFEPAASWSRTKHSTGLSHTPITVILYHGAGVLSISNTQKVRFKICFPHARSAKKGPAGPF